MKQDKAILVLKIIYFICIRLFPILILLTILLKCLYELLLFM